MPLVRSSLGRLRASPELRSFTNCFETTVFALCEEKIVILCSKDFLPFQTIELDQSVTSVSLCKQTGWLAIGSHGVVHIYRPEEPNKYTQVNSYKFKKDCHVTCLDWGLSHDLVVSHGNTITILNISTGHPVLEVWSQQTVRPVQRALLSPDASYIASVEEDSPLVKVWMRTSPQTGVASVYDYSYLPHSSPVAFLQWNAPLMAEENEESMYLATVSSDGVLHIWRFGSLFGSQLMHLANWLDLKDYSPSALYSHFGFLTKHDLACILSASPESSNKAFDPFLVWLQRQLKTKTDLFVMFSASHLHLWSVSTTKNDSVSLSLISRTHMKLSDHALTKPNDFLHFCFTKPNPSNAFYFFDDNDDILTCFSVTLSGLFDYEKKTPHALARFTGHSSAIKCLHRTPNGHGFVSRDDTGRCVFYSFDCSRQQFKVKRGSSLTPSPDATVVPLFAGEYGSILQEDRIELWHCVSEEPVLLATCNQVPVSNALSVFILPIQMKADSLMLCCLTKGGHSWFWRVDISDLEKPSITFVDRLKFTKDLDTASPIDVMGWSSLLYPSFPLDAFNREVFASISKEGLLQTWTATVTSDNTPRVLELSRVQTSVRDATLIKGSTSKIVAVVSENGSRLSVFDMRSSEFSSQEESSAVFPELGPIIDLDWTSTPNSHSILAVSFKHDVVLICQNRRSYIMKSPLWVPIVRVNTSSFTDLPIRDSTWLDNGTLVLACGTGIYYFDKTLPQNPSLLYPYSVNRQSKDLFDLVYQLNGILPVYHPQFLQQLMLNNKISLILLILHRVYECLQQNNPLHFLLNIEAEKLILPSAAQDDVQSQVNSVLDEIKSGNDSVEETAVNSLNEWRNSLDWLSSLEAQLKSQKVQTLTRTSQFLLLNFIEAFHKTLSVGSFLDLNGRRYCLMLNQYTLLRHQTKEKSQLPFRDCMWAFYSSNQDVLLGYSKQLLGNFLLWDDVRELGLPYWLSQSSLCQVFRELAQNHYTHNDERNPEFVSLYYMALRKKAVLVNLWKLASWHKESARTVKLLSNDFTLPRWRVAAAKNAFALLSRHRYFYAAAFFLLGDQCLDAVRVCIRNLNDPALAIAVARVYEGDDGPTFSKLLVEFMLPISQRYYDRFLACWCFEMLKNKAKAIQCLVSPLYSTIRDDAELKKETTATATLLPRDDDALPGHPQDKNGAADDPALILLYVWLRDQFCTFGGSASQLRPLGNLAPVNPSHEFKFVLHMARVYDQMGCDLTALSLVRNWTFLHTTSPTTEPPSNDSITATEGASTAKETPTPEETTTPQTAKPRVSLMGQTLTQAPSSIPDFDESAFFF
ncbi:RAVE complex subunit Rav1 [Schizosaccharomyces japonicus yFS275]|uniref:RAVE complex subunit Rav1 n=1 Tax=Schizosaccharomyces japonicus (strain yFS275 / FY16936) TaxID=402676 RepID=B6JV94_SCHJY|nr:RAVE complex subunit Rav1 [Schizosaccharomyces japonicus yFS275]EEB05295.1 RAVE complex subunit Rav1 [Schizosaccharomyces japonicus yFS275]